MVSIKYHVIIKTPLLNPNPISSIQSSSKKNTHTHTHEHTTCSFLWSSAFYAFWRSVYRRLGSWSEHHTKATEWTAAVKKSTFIIDLCFGSKSVFKRDEILRLLIKCFHFAVLKLQFFFQFLGSSFSKSQLLNTHMDRLCLWHLGQCITHHLDGDQFRPITSWLVPIHGISVDGAPIKWPFSK